MRFENLEKYYGKTVVKVVTTLSSELGDIIVGEYEKKVFIPGKKMITFCDGCDLVIGSKSANSKDFYNDEYVYDKDVSVFSFDKYDSITVYNFCFPDEVEEVKEFHIKRIKEALNQHKFNLSSKKEKVERLLAIV